MPRQEHRITLPQPIRNRAQQRADELGYSTVLEYLTELVVIDTSPLVARQAAQVSPQPPAQQQSPITIAASGWGDEL